MKRKDITAIVGSKLDDDEISALLDAIHGEKRALQDEIGTLKSDLASTKESLESEKSGKTKAENELSDYKAEVSRKEANAKKTAQYRDVLVKSGIRAEHIDKVLRHSAAEIEAVELDESGNLKNADAVAEAVKKEWGEYIPTRRTHSAQVDLPPDNSGAGGGKVLSLRQAISETQKG